MTTTLKVVLNAVSSHFNMEPRDIFENSRKRKIIWPRQLFHYAASQWTLKSLNRIGGYGNEIYQSKKFDHATVLHSKKAILNQLHIKDRETWKDVQEIDYIISATIFLEAQIIPTDIDLLSKCERYSKSFI